MATFAELLRGLDARTALSPATGDYATGVGLAAHTLVNVLVNPDSPPTARIQAAKDIADRCEGRPRQAAPTSEGDIRLTDLDKSKLNSEEWSLFQALLLRMWPAELDEPNTDA